MSKNTKGNMIESMLSKAGLTIVDGRNGSVIMTAQPATNSLKVAEFFGRKHKNILQAIDNLECSEAFSRLNFQPRDYVDERGKTQRSVVMTRKGFEFLTLGFSGRKAAQFREAYIERFHQMEAHIQQEAAQAAVSAYRNPPFITVTHDHGRGSIAVIKEPNPNHQQEIPGVHVAYSDDAALLATKYPDNPLSQVH
jgi:Rha family phage regulatory protein